MRSTTRALATSLTFGALLVTTLSACNADHSAAVLSLERQLAKMDNVASVTQTYEAGDTLFPGSGGFEIAMSAGASDDDVVNVFTTVFAKAEDDFGGDSVDAGIYYGNDEIRLHVQDSSAEKSDVRSVIRFALSAREHGETLYLDVNALDDDGFEELESTLEFRLPKGSDRADVIPRFDRFDAAAVPVHTDVMVRAADESALSGFDGLPSEDVRSVFRELNAAPYARSFAVDFGPLNTAPGSSKSAMVVVDLSSEPKLPTEERNRRRVAFMVEHIRVISAVTPRFRYYVNKGTPAVVQLDQSVCTEDFEGWRGEVERYYEEHSQMCSAD